MSPNLIRSVVLSAVLLVAATVLAACNDSSTASNIQDPAASATTRDASGQPVEASATAEPATSGDAEADSAVSAEPASPPATGPDPSTTVPGDYPDPAPSAVPLTDGEKRYVQELQRENVSFKGDTDSGIALTIGHYVCQARANRTDPTMIKAYVTAAIGPATSDVAEANAAADKVIAAAGRHLC